MQTETERERKKEKKRDCETEKKAERECGLNFQFRKFDPKTMFSLRYITERKYKQTISINLTEKFFVKLKSKKIFF